ncbi:type II secretion system protein [Enterococcus casseliflavus]|jgi:type IV pilus assembly protein PilA|uniref:type II secretion system protein n=1 Tax=Enterococcus casseliflavus TaxID=37734 RepID=UPI00040E8C28|nr:prepilin-type N-terminal cleavage/methylation domain-containing protein [Enterococcus casseliflavus]MDO7872715.1 prepilin-type N-terminal cleavage/methylation domain-containing protein [Enterococcus casseliflavus]
MIDAILAEETTDNRLNKLLKDERGLSLVELLAVVVILAIIAGIGVIAIGNVIQNSREDAVISEVQQAYAAAVLYHSTTPSLNSTSAAATTFTLLDVMDAGLMNSTSWGTSTGGDSPTGAGRVVFTIAQNGSLTMTVPAGALMAGQEPNNALTNATQNDINSLTRDDFFRGNTGGGDND